MAHTVVKPELIAKAALGALTEKLTVPQLFTKQGMDEFKGALDDKVSVVIPGTLPFRTYAFRNDRSSPITFDEYAERKIQVGFQSNVYSAVRLTDEQADFDTLGDWAKLMDKQTSAIARGLQRAAVSALTTQTYNVTVGKFGTDTRAALIEARRVLNQFRVPDEDRFFVMGSNVAETMVPAAYAKINLMDDTEVRSFELGEITPRSAV